MLERMVRSAYSLVFITVVFACSPEPDFNIQNHPPHSLSDYYLKEYYEENRLLQSFEYDKDRLFRFWVYSERGESSTQFVYKEDGRLDSVYVRQRYFPRDLFFHYQDSLIMEWEVWNGNKLRQWVFFDRDNKGRIIRMSQISLVFGLLVDVFFEWEGQNITRYESTVYNFPDISTYVYEFKYDQFRNPYHSVFQNIGFNFIDNLPLTENNWLEMLVYEKGDYEGTKINYLNKFGYGGKYPFVKESTQIKDKIRKGIYAEYKY